MIILLLLSFIGGAVGLLLSPLPSITELPFGIDAALVTAASNLNGFITILWPFQILWQCTLWYIGLEITLMLIRFFLPHRIPRLGGDL